MTQRRVHGLDGSFAVKFEWCPAGDWVRIYVNGKFFREGHSVDQFLADLFYEVEIDLEQTHVECAE